MAPTPDELREEFVRLLTVDGPTKDRRRKDFNQAIFMGPDPALDAEAQAWWIGKPVWDETTLDMVMEKFDRAVKNLSRR